jgi:hypothetical protein
MGAQTQNVRLLVISDRVQLPNVFNAVPCGEYDGYADWQTMDDCERHMTAVRVMIDEEGLGRMGKSGGIPSMDREVLRYLKAGDIIRVD